MISRRNFIKFLGLGAAYMSTGFSVAQAAYSQSVITLSDFGGLIHKPVKGFVTQTDKAQAIIKSGNIIHPRGTGHSVVGQSMRKNAMIFTPDDIDIKLQNDVVYASGGTTLLDIDMYLEEFGYMLPTSPDHRAVSLGGVLSVGGYGGEVCRYGALVDNAVSLDLLMPDGQILKNVTPDKPLFKKVVCGVGQHGTILKAGVTCVKKPLFSHVKYEDIPSVDFYMKQVRDFLNTPVDDQYSIWYAHWSRKQNQLTRGHTIFDKDAPAPKNGFIVRDDYRADRKRISDAWVFKRPYQYNVWSDHFFTLENFQPALERALEIRQEGQDMGGSVIIYSSITRSNKKMDHFPHYSDQDYMMSVGIFGNFLAEKEDAAKAFAHKQMLYSKQSQDEWSGRPYRYGWEWREGFDI